MICGFGRVGSAVGEAFDTFDVPYTVIERDPDVVKALRQRGVTAIFGDAAHREILVEAGLQHATLVVLTVPEIASARLGVRAVRALRPDTPILARAHHAREADHLRELGATEVIQPEVEAGATLIRHALARLALPKERTLDYLSRFRMMDTPDPAPVAPNEALPEVREIVLPPGTFADESLREARIRERFGVTVVGIRRGGETVLNPPPDAILRAGDRLRVFGLRDQLDAFAERAADD
jgi:CPA2 family monovalent cation:H+ antiporter-2